MDLDSRPATYIHAFDLDPREAGKGTGYDLPVQVNQTEHPALGFLLSAPPDFLLQSILPYNAGHRVGISLFASHRSLPL